jgi:hypothetical protein
VGAAEGVLVPVLVEAGAGGAEEVLLPLPLVLLLVRMVTRTKVTRKRAALQVAEQKNHAPSALCLTRMMTGEGIRRCQTMTMLEGAVSAVAVAGAVAGAGEVAVPVLLVLAGAGAEVGEEALLLPLLVLLLQVRWQTGKAFCVVCQSSCLVHFFFFYIDVFSLRLLGRFELTTTTMMMKRKMTMTTKIWKKLTRTPWATTSLVAAATTRRMGWPQQRLAGKVCRYVRNTICCMFCCDAMVTFIFNAHSILLWLYTEECKIEQIC